MALTLTLNSKWDIALNESGDIATSSGSYAIAQNVANAVRLFTNDAFFDTDRGIPHFEIELGNNPAQARSTLANRIKQAALSVEGVTAAEVTLEFSERTYSGEIIITTEDGNSASIGL